MKTIQLQLKFKNSEGKSVNYVVRHPKLELDEETIKTAMEKIVEANVSVKNGVELYREVVSATYVEKLETPIFDFSD
ncbi:MAG: DUF2922 domain-containing protein [Bavariicoccus seileri]|uniref:DUF2922 domain-containing protein n=1 Tax=Bavariicoccus seileri TaxID=549685 RepID=UPI0003B69175|nr:DUF2922 domain-containing protein [Bavariicoccus seileri]